MNKLTPEQEKKRAQMLRAHYGDQDTHDYRSPKEWNKQAFRLHVKTTLFNTALNLALAIVLGTALIVGLLKLSNKL